MLPEVKAYLTTNFEWYVYLFALAAPICIALLGYIINGIFYLTIWYHPHRKQPYSDPFFWIAIVIVILLIYNGFHTFIGEVRDYLSHHPKATAWYNNVAYDLNPTLRGTISLIALIAGAVLLFLIERREKFLGAVPFYTILIFLFVTPLFYNVQFEREGLLPKEAAGCILGLQLTCFFVLHWALNRKFRFIKSNILLPLGLFIGWCLIGFFIFPHQLAAVKNLKQLVTFAAIFFSIACFVKSERHLRILLVVAIIAANISVLWGEMRFFGINIFGLQDSYFQEPKAGKSFLLSGFFANPNYLAEFLAIIILMCIGLGLNTKHRGAKTVLFFLAGLDTFHLLMTYTRAAWVGIGLGAIAAEMLFLLYLFSQKPFEPSRGLATNTKRFLLNFLAGVITVRALLMVLAFYLMFSKGLFNGVVYFAQIVGLAILAIEVWFYISGNKILRSETSAKTGTGPTLGFAETPIGSAGITLVTFLIVFGAFYGVTQNLAAKTASYPHVISPSERAASITDFKGDETFRNRLNMWKVGLEMAKAHPFFGNGLGAYDIEYLEYQDRIVSRYSFEDFSKWFHNTIPTFRAHNDHIQTLCELGILGFIFWAWFWVAVFITAWRGFIHARSFGERFFILAVFASMVSINISGFFSFPFHKIQTGGLTFMLIGYMAYLRHRQMQPVPPTQDDKKTGKKAGGGGKGRPKAALRAKVRKTAPMDHIAKLSSYENLRCNGGPGAIIQIIVGIIFLAILLLTALGMYTQIQHFRSNTFFAWGTRFITEKYGNDYNASRDYWFRRATEVNPSNGRAEFFWGWATTKTEQYEIGEKRLRHAQYLYPQTDTHYTLGLNLTWWGNKLAAEGDDEGARGKYGDAINAFMTASQRLPTRLEYYTELVKLLNRVGRFDEAAKYSERAIIVYNWVTMAQNVEYLFYMWRGQALIAQGRLDEAIEVLSEAPKLIYDKQRPEKKAAGAKPIPLENQPQAYLLLGQAYEKKGDLAKAEEQYNIHMTRNNRIPKESRANDILFFQGRLYEKIADTREDEESRLKYKAWAKQKYILVAKINEELAELKVRKGGNLTSQDRKQFFSQYGKPLGDKMYQEALKGLERIKAGEPYPIEEELILIESETVGVGEAEIEVEEEAR